MLTNFVCIRAVKLAGAISLKSNLLKTKLLKRLQTLENA